MKKILIIAAFAMLHFSIHAQKTLTLEQAVREQFRAFAPTTMNQLSWMGKSDMYAYVKDNQLMVGKLKAKATDEVLMNLESFNQISGLKSSSFPMIQWIDASKFSIDTETGIVELDLKARKSSLVCAAPSEGENLDYHARAHNMAFTRGNDLYAMIGTHEVRITKNSADIVSGQSVSRNEYGITKGTFWSPDGSLLAFYQKDESEVANYPLINYQVTPATVKNIKYPMAGQTSEKIDVGVYNVNSEKTIFLQIHPQGLNDQYYATNLTWSPDNKKIYIAWLNRATNWMRFMAYDAATGNELGMLFEEKDEQWVEPLFPAYFLPNNPELFVWISQRDGFNNLYLYNTKGVLQKKSKLPFDITEFLGFSPEGDYAFVMATGDVPTESMCYRIRMSDMGQERITNVHGTHACQISGSGEYVIDQFSNLSTPNKIDIVQYDGRLVKSLHQAANPYQDVRIGNTELFAIKANDGVDLWCRLIKPSHFDSKKKYPVLVYVYGGPHAQMVTNSYLGGASLWMHHLAEEGYLVFTLDNHGSANRGRDFQQVIHRQLGTKEMEDQILGVEWLKKQSFVDANRMAVHGWSFGGFMTSSLMTRYPGTFKVGVAGGPVIDWSKYEVMYGERYMDTPQENPKGYETSNLCNQVKNLQGKLLMIHGMDDDVVVIQHNVQFLKAAIDQGVQVDFFEYPTHAHNVRGKDRVHLMKKVLDYVKDGLK
jgi:dipeptidyl-peptidase-4